MRAAILHVFLTAYVAPCLGVILLIYLGPALDSTHVGVPGHAWESVVVGLIAPLLLWVVLVPLGLCSYAYFRWAAFRHYFGLLHWIVASVIIGALSAAVCAALMPSLAYVHVSITTFAIVGALARGIVSPLDRFFFKDLYEDGALNVK